MRYLSRSCSVSSFAAVSYTCTSAGVTHWCSAGNSSAPVRAQWPPARSARLAATSAPAVCLPRCAAPHCHARQAADSHKTAHRNRRWRSPCQNDISDSFSGRPAVCCFSVPAHRIHLIAAPAHARAAVHPSQTAHKPHCRSTLHRMPQGTLQGQPSNLEPNRAPTRPTTYARFNTTSTLPMHKQSKSAAALQTGRPMPPAIGYQEYNRKQQKTAVI